VGKTMKKYKKKEGFTIVELLTVMSIIIILMSILVPVMGEVRKHVMRVQQMYQFKAIGSGLELYRNDLDGYPESSIDIKGTHSATGGFSYSGAMKLTEAIMGQDLLGYHSSSRLREDYSDGINTSVYLYQRGSQGQPPDAYNLSLRKGPYLKLDESNAYRLWNVYKDHTINKAGFYREVFVLLDIYNNVENNSQTGEALIGMPILYYRANTSGTYHPHFENNDIAKSFIGYTDSPENIYDYRDNDLLIQMGIPGNPDYAHLMASGNQTTSHGTPLNSSSERFFYHNTFNENIAITAGRPHNYDSYILISAGFDGEYGTSDDVFNFQK
jgi:type II secretory pathway pseudopilin PulG